MKVSLAYGRSTISVELPDSSTIIAPSHQPGLEDERASLLGALDSPVAAPPLRTLIQPGSPICIVHTDITRATPNERIIPWLLAYLEQAGARDEDITLLNGLGTHRPNTEAELAGMLTPAVVKRYRCLNHEPENDAACTRFGETRGGAPALLHSALASASVRIITGFIEPHFFAGFSGGPKGIMPGVAALRTVQSNHGASHIGDPRATFGVTEGNPIWEEMRDIALRPGPSFLLNVALNETREITGVFAGDLIAAHRTGCEFVRASAMQPQPHPYDVVITTNSGYPLDMNLCQGVKGMRAADLIVREGGRILLVAECIEGFPSGSPHERLLRSVWSPAEILEKVAQPGFAWPEQWQSQIQAVIQRRATLHLFSSMPEADVRAAHLEPCASIESFVAEHCGPGARIAVLPQGPLTVPYLTGRTF